jgi:colicin import membrane protein
VLERGRLIDGEAKRISSQLAAIEDPIVDQIKAEERRIEAERQAAIAAEQERLAAIEREKREAEERKLAEERAKLAAERADLERQQALLQRCEQKRNRPPLREEADRQARASIEAEPSVPRAMRIAAAEAKARQSREAKAKLRSVSASTPSAVPWKTPRAPSSSPRMKPPTQRLEEQRKREAEENARAKAEREKRRQEQELMDARAMLDTFVQRFGHRKEFASVVTAIKALLRKKAA